MELYFLGMLQGLIYEGQLICFLSILHQNVQFLKGYKRSWRMLKIHHICVCSWWYVHSISIVDLSLFRWTSMSQTRVGHDNLGCASWEESGQQFIETVHTLMMTNAHLWTCTLHETSRLSSRQTLYMISG